MLARFKKRLGDRLLRRWSLENAVLHGRCSYAQEGEDVLLARIMDGSSDDTKGIYVDVGSNHPFKMSNTAMLYERGWSGIAIDPNPEFAPLYAQMRSRDIFVNCGIANNAGALIYHQFDESLYNTFDTEKADLIAKRHSRLIKRWEVPVRRLDAVLREHWPQGKEVRFLSVDCEGLDLEVLQSHDFEAYPTDFVCAEVHATTLSAALDSSVVEFLRSKRYGCISKLCNSCLFLRQDLFEKYDV